MKKLVAFLPAVLYYALMFVLSSQDIGLPFHEHQLDKLVHVVEFAILAFLLSLGFFSALNASSRTKAIIVFSIALSLGLLDEFHQHFIPGRRADLYDLLADAVGAALGVFFYWHLTTKTRKNDLF